MRRKGCSAQGLRTNGGRRPPYCAAEGGILNCRRSRLLMGAECAILNCAAQAALLIYEPPAEPAPYGRRRRLTVPLTIFCKRHGRPRPPPRHFDRAFGVFLQKARSVAPSAPPFRPCLWRFFTKGTVGYALCPAISTVPLAFFYKRHGRPRPLLHNFDRAFGVFLQKARSAVPSALQFRPCLWRFFAKGTVGYALRPTISTVPLTLFCKRHGRLRRLPRDFDRAFDAFLQKARSIAPSVPRFRPCLS